MALGDLVSISFQGSSFSTHGIEEIDMHVLWNMHLLWNVNSRMYRDHPGA
jgi:hypothetical protein